jgi:hypothetical protein
MRLTKCKVVYPGPPQSEEVQGTTYEANDKTGINELIELESGDVLVKGKRTTFKFKAANVVWVQPAEDSPVASASEDPSLLAAPLESPEAGPTDASTGKKRKK